MGRAQPLRMTAQQAVSLTASRPETGRLLDSTPPKKVSDKTGELVRCPAMVFMFPNFQGNLHSARRAPRGLHGTDPVDRPSLFIVPGSMRSLERVEVAPTGDLFYCVDS